MDSLVAAAARALALGDTLLALKHVALRDDPSALALRGIAMAQLGEHARARELLRRAVRGFERTDEVARARCAVAEAEVALAVRDLAWSPRALDAARRRLEAHGDRQNALHAELVAARRLLLLGRLDEAQAALAALPPMSPALRAVSKLVAAEIAARTLRPADARAALAAARDAAVASAIPALLSEVDAAREAFDRPVARALRAGGERPLGLDAVAEIMASGALVVDACRRTVRRGARVVSLARRPVLLALARALGEAAPGDVGRDDLIARAFNAARPNASHRARLRVDMGRLRRALAPFARIEATAAGFALRAGSVIVLAPPLDGEHAELLALLGDGEAWSTSALALALGASQRSVQRALSDLESVGRVRAVGNARARRWLTQPLTGFTTTLLLPATLLVD